MRHRRRFLAATLIIALAVVLASLAFGPAPAQPRTYVWKVQSAFPVSDYPHRSLLELAKSIDQMSGGRLKIEPLPVGSVVGPTVDESLDSASRQPSSTSAGATQPLLSGVHLLHTWSAAQGLPMPCSSMYAQ